MSEVDEKEKTGQTSEEPKKINEDQIGIGVDESGFWHFTIHSKKDVHTVVGFLDMAKDTVKNIYMAQLRSEAEKKKKNGLIRPDRDSLMDNFKGKFRG